MTERESVADGGATSPSLAAYLRAMDGAAEGDGGAPETLVGNRLPESPAPVLVTSYDLLRQDARDWEAVELDVVVLDEAHYIKNHATRTARAVKRLSSRRRLALTGTPLENRLSELWSVLDFLMPGLLGPYQRFREQFEAPIIGGRQRGVSTSAHVDGALHPAPYQGPGGS